MSLIKKHKKYQYLYLKYKIQQKQEKMYWYNDHCGFDTEKEDARLDYIWDWLETINKKYNYVKTDNRKLPTLKT
tara:strand:+ start:566 stop:787 length:222 start_codon:yes stop_codon:yes gene_type:complete